MKKYLFFGLLLLFFLFVTLISTSLLAIEETGGIGMKVAQLFDYTKENHKGPLVVLDVFRGSPAEESGILIGDIITHINGELTRNNDFRDLLHNKLRGPAGTELELKIWRTSTKSRLKKTLTRIHMVY